MWLYQSTQSNVKDSECFFEWSRVCQPQAGKPATTHGVGNYPRRLATYHKYALFKGCAMLGVVQVEDWGMSLGFLFGFIRVVVGERVANEGEGCHPFAALRAGSERSEGSLAAFVQPPCLTWPGGLRGNQQLPFYCHM